MPSPLPTRRVAAPLAALVAVLLLLGLVAADAASGQSTVTRLDASTPVEAGIAVSAHVFADGATDHVILVRDDTFADALVAGPVAGDLPGLAPILFTPTDALPAEVADEIDRVTGGAGTVHVIGGEAAVSADVTDGLEADGYTVQRIAGASRIETAQAVFATFFAADLDGGDVMVARAFGSTPDESDAWPDAVTGGGFGAARGVPILLTPTEAIPAGVLTQVDAAGAAIVLGGTAAVSTAVEQSLSEVVEEVIRVGGATREATAVAVAEGLFGISALEARDVAVLVNGRTSFAYGLAASSLAAAGRADGEAPILLVTADGPVDGCEGSEAATATACWLSAEGTEAGEIVIVGDTDQVGADVEAAALALRGDAAPAEGAGDGGSLLDAIGDLLGR